MRIASKIISENLNLLEKGHKHSKIKNNTYFVLSTNYAICLNKIILLLNIFQNKT